MIQLLRQNPSPFCQKRLPFTLVTLALLSGLALSIVSWLRLCTESCAPTHDYRFFGFTFEPLGLVFFTTIVILQLLSLKFDMLSRWVAFMVAGALGVEVMLTLVQKLQIGQWCPVCLSIAGTLAIAGFILLFSYARDFKAYLLKGERRMIARFSVQVFFAICAAALGFVIALMGVTKIDESSIAELDNDNLKKEDPIFGKRNSNVEVYIITDWFCPACRALEPVLDGLYPKIAAQAGLMFVDFPIHPDSMNYIPYNLSFMLKEKQKYFQIRKTLQRLALTKKAPTIQEVQAAVAPLKVTYQPLNYIDVDSGLRFFEEIAKTFEVKSTPTIVIVNRKTHAYKILHGTLQINEEEVLGKIKEMALSK